MRKSVHVDASPDVCFRVFTEQLTSWWPLASHHIGKVEAKEAIIEPRVGGRFFERGIDGSECLWGHVKAWEPPRRVVLSWELDGDWKHDPRIRSEVEVTFVAEKGGTRVDLEHRDFGDYGERAAEVRNSIDSPGGWTGILASFAARAASSA